MYAIIQPFLQIALLRRPPQELPYSTLLLGLTLAMHLLLGIVLYLFQYGFITAVLAAATGTAMLCALSYALLYLNNHQQRFVQTLCALAGTDILIGLISIPVLTFSGQGPASLLYLLILIWNLAVASHILRHALSISYAQGIAFALLFFLITVIVTQPLLSASA